MSETPTQLKPFTFHGVSFGRESGGHVAADCPLCSREGKFFVNVSNGLWDCKKCGASGNPLTFLRLLWEVSDRVTKDYKKLTDERKLLNPDTAMTWGAVRSVLTGDWMLPGYSPDGALNNLYRYSRDPKTKKMRLLSTAGQHHQPFGVPLMNRDAETVYLCEGSWDAMALWEVLGQTKATETGYASTGNVEASLRAEASVIAVPGCNAFHDSWASLFTGKRVVICFDSDHPVDNNGTILPGAGWAGAKRVAEKLARAEEPPESIHVLRWGPDGYDPEQKSGWDVRDVLTANATSISDRIANLTTLLTRVEPIPEDWVAGRSKATANRGGTSIEPLACRDWRTLVNSWRKAMKWPESGTGLDHALACMLASILSTKAVGDQLWMKIIGPASCGKSTLCEAVSVARKYVLAKSTIRGFHSGFGSNEEEDNSLIAQVRDKTLVTKDGDTLLQSPNLPQILSEARDVYDRTSRTHYRNKMSKDYEGVNMTWLLCGTSSLKSIDSSELGERFLDCVIMETIDDDVEDEILDRVAEKADAALSFEATGDVDTQYDPSLLEAMRLTGGYVEYLRQNAQSLLHGVTCGTEAKDRLKTLAKFVSYMRARPSAKQDEQSEREFSARLLSQLLRLGKCLAVVLNKREVDDEVLVRVRRVARDTARGRTLDIARRLVKYGDDGMEPQTLATVTHYGLEKTRTLLRFLRSIGAVEWFEPASDDGKKVGRVRWRLTPRVLGIVRDADGE